MAERIGPVALKPSPAYARKGDTIVVWKLDRFGRSLVDLVQTVAQLRERGVGFRSLPLDRLRVCGGESIICTTAPTRAALELRAAPDGSAHCGSLPQQSAALTSGMLRARPVGPRSNGAGVMVSGPTSEPIRRGEHRRRGDRRRRRPRARGTWRFASIELINQVVRIGRQQNAAADISPHMRCRTDTDALIASRKL